MSEDIKKPAKIQRIDIDKDFGGRGIFRENEDRLKKIVELVEDKVPLRHAIKQVGYDRAEKNVTSALFYQFGQVKTKRELIANIKNYLANRPKQNDQR